MDERLPLGSPDAATLAMLLERERELRRGLVQENARQAAGLLRQNERISLLEQRWASSEARSERYQALVEGLLEQSAFQQQRIAELEARVVELTAVPRPEKRPPGAWPSEETKKERDQRPRKTREGKHNHGRQRSRQVDERVEHAVDACPRCGGVLFGGWVHRRVQVTELPEPQGAVVTEHVIIRRQCTACGCRVLPPGPAQSHGRVGRRQFGPRLIALVATMASVERLPIRQIRERLRREYGVCVSHGGIVGLLHGMARVGAPALARVQEQIRGSPVVHADETGWRENGTPGYVWTISTPNACLFHRDPSRAGTVIDGLLTEEFGGILVTDFYAAYDHLPGMKQRCWAHLWRDIDALEHEYPEDRDLAAWIAGVRAIYDLALTPRPQEEVGETPQAVRARHRRAERYEGQLLLLCPQDMSSDRPQATLAKRIRRYGNELFTFVREPGVPTTNNAAERSLRPLVIARKMSGGTRSAAGSTTRMTLASLAATARLQGANPTDRFMQLLVAPAEPHTL